MVAMATLPCVTLDTSHSGRPRARSVVVSGVLASAEMYERPGYGTLIGRIRENVRTYIRKQIELPKQEISEILHANLRAVKWFAIALAFGLMALVSVVVLLVALLGWILTLVLPFPVAYALSAFLVLLLLIAGAAFTGWRGYKSLDIRGPQRSIESFKETVSWARSERSSSN